LFHEQLPEISAAAETSVGEAAEQLDLSFGATFIAQERLNIQAMQDGNHLAVDGDGRLAHVV
jgi:hypothetical protein